ncbi:MAG: hypothetical protein NTV30_10685 [Chloroflexi bacterium]|nr:hypothetical protein [Chloroflexota bacterium]
MLKKLIRCIKNTHRNELGITGLETAIILIAFVTVASVLAYSVLSAGVFSAERGKETVYSGLKSAQSTLEVKGSLIGLDDADNDALGSVQFTIGLAVQGEKVDMDTMVINYFDVASNVLSSQSTERGTANILEGDEQIIVTLTVPGDDAVQAYDWFILQCIPSGGSTMTLKRTMGGAIDDVMNLN